ncbi:MAG: CpaF family protein [Actinomycetota bacterium]
MTTESFSGFKEAFKRYYASRHESLGDGPTPADIRQALSAYIKRERLIMKAGDVRALEAGLIEEITAYGPLTPLFQDGEVTEVMVNGTTGVYIEKNGTLSAAERRFASNTEIFRLIERFLSPIGARVDESKPYADGRLNDGSRINVIIPPVSLDGPVVTIRRFPDRSLTLDKMVESGCLTAAQAKRLSRAVRAKKNIVVSGGTGTGKTTFLNALAGRIANSERLITIEDAAELKLPKPNLVRLQSRPPNNEGKGEVTIRDLVRNALRMRPDRIIVGEVRGGEALDMLQAMNTGHEGSMTTVHANSCADALRRLEIMVLMAGVGLPHAAARDLLLASLDIVVQLARGPDGRRRLVEILEVSAEAVDA